MAAERPIRWGILGAGRIADKFAKGLRLLPDAQLVAIASRDGARGTAFAVRHDVSGVHTSYESLVGDPDIDVVYVATLNTAHYSNARLCIDGGKAVLCEKPFMMTAAETREILLAARRAKVFCMEAMWMRFLPLAYALRSRLSEGILGDIVNVSANLGFSAPFDPHGRLFSKQLGGGALLDLGVYPLSFIHMILGAPISVTAQASIGSTSVDEHVIAQLAFANGSSAVMETSIVSHLRGGATVSGTTGTMHIHGPLYCPTALTHTQSGADDKDRDGTFSKVKEWARRAGMMSGAGTREVFPVQGNGYAHQAAEVMRCLRAGALESGVMPLDESLRVMETMDAVRVAWDREGSAPVSRAS